MAMFTPVHTSLGALLLYQGSSGLLLHNGAVFGISSLLAGSLLRPSWENVPIIAGLVSSLVPVALFMPSLIPAYPTAPDSWTALLSTLATGFLLGWGTKNGRGCTSGHMLCGVSRLSPRSFIATAIFFTTALLTANFFPTGQDLQACAGGLPCYLPVYPTVAESSFMVVATLLTFATNWVAVPRILKRSHRSRAIFAYLAGLQFGTGLLFSGMADSEKVLRFLIGITKPSRFDPSLALVVLFGIIPSMVAYRSRGPRQENKRGSDGPMGGMSKPTLAETWRLPTATVADIDWRFVTGSVVFGMTWGLRGVCPGPAVLRSAVQPTWGLAEMAGYVLGNLV
ncbi:YeeE/YedE family protein [Aspergillus saccharolyticus JOP 1030-1]|uniref:YeeE/YedE family integral membrane protein n=1 Tax=Aspergillus saccharolyticus JOP 1030-1 TaxID=1450539 RepID=A0A319A5M8_9EURO|nr:YeeE/YedE family integral membrane protein [Aspergillus saccharolyticus JOP 1030-1]PYH47368.1 YeeE/YedE family integral membrane protein [Aspergillus saccharolyticus JOP 1030-1]